MTLDSEIWGPHYWFVLHTITLTYPKNPSETIKKKYYKFIQDLPFFLPDEKISNNFSKLLNKYPVSPYLDSKEAFIKWVHFIHNIINKKLNKKTINMSEFLIEYYENYKPKELINLEYKKNKEKIIYSGLLILLISVTLYLYHK
jgi:hypothetical protein